MRACPCCHSLETESLRSAYQRGAYRSSIEKEKVAPPRKRRVAVLMVLMVLTGSAIAVRTGLAAAAAPDGPGRLGAGSSIMGGLIFLVAAAWGLVRAERYNKTIWPAAMQEWEGKLRCRACRHVFPPGEPWPVIIPRLMEERRAAILPHA